MDLLSKKYAQAKEIEKLKQDIEAYKQSEQEASEIIAELKAENDRLKEENVKLLFGKGALVEFCNKLTQIIDEKKESENKLLQTLQEIKAIAEADVHIVGDEKLYYDSIEKILQVITKAEEE